MLCVLLHEFEIARGVLAERADVVVGQGFADVFVAADLAAPFVRARGELVFILGSLGARLDVGLVVGVCGRGRVRQDLHGCGHSDEECVGAQVDGLLHVYGEVCVGALGDIRYAVVGVFAVGVAREFVDIAA